MEYIESDIYEVWNGYDKLNLPNLHFYMDSMIYDLDGLKLCMSSHESSYPYHITILFEGHIDLVRCIPESNRIYTSGELFSETERFYKNRAFLYIVNKSSLIEWLKIESCGALFEDEYFKYNHFCIITPEDFTDIITTCEPTIIATPSIKISADK